MSGVQEQSVRTETARLTQPKTLILAILAALAAFAMSLGAPQQALAHDQLLSSSPADGEQLDASPDAWELTFSGNILETGVALTIVDDKGAAAPIGAPEVNGKTVTALIMGLPNGQYTGHWRVVSEDGHPIAGQVVFGIGVPAGEAVEPVAGSEMQPAETQAPGAADPRATMATSPAGEPTEGATQDGQTDTVPEVIPDNRDESGGVNPLPWVIGAVGLAGIAALAIALMRRPARDEMLQNATRTNTAPADDASATDANAGTDTGTPEASGSSAADSPSDER